MGRARRVVVLDDYGSVAERFADWASLDTTVLFEPEHLAPDATVARLAGADVVVCMRERTPLTAAMLERLPDLRLVVTTGMRNASLDLDACRRLGIEVRGTDSLVTPTAELTWALIHAITRRVEAEDAAVRDGRWQPRIGGDLAGRTLGLVGLGRLGQRVARVAAAFEMPVVAWSPHLTPERAAAAGARLLPLDDLLAPADVVSLHLVLGASTRGVIGAEQLTRMKPSAWLVNTARGPLVDEDALLAALRSRAIAGAALDVFAVEPLPHDSPLRMLDNVILSPHAGYVTKGSYEVFLGQAVEDVVAWQRGEALRLL